MQKQIAVTGGIGSGKSTVLSLLKEKGYSVYSCDEISKSLFFETEYVKEIEKAFPSVVIDNKIERAKLRELVFSDALARERLNAITHPIIMKRLFSRMRQDSSLIVFAEVPLLFEGGFENKFCETIIVKRNIQDRIKAICTRDKIGEEDALKKIRAQFDYDNESNDKWFDSIGAHVIRNDGDIKLLQLQIDKVLQDINMKHFS